MAAGASVRTRGCMKVIHRFGYGCAIDATVGVTPVRDSEIPRRVQNIHHKALAIDQTEIFVVPSPPDTTVMPSVIVDALLS